VPNVKIGPQSGDLDVEKLTPPGNGKVMAAQLHKKNAG